MATIITSKDEVITIDDDLVFLLSPMAWHVSNSGYAMNRNRSRTPANIRMHRYAWELKHGPIPAGMDIDHINRNRLDNRDENLRLATRSQNLARRKDYANQHGFRGVARRRYGKYRGYVWKDRKQHWTATVDTPEEAAQLRDDLAIELHGEFAVLNFEPR